MPELAQRFGFNLPDALAGYGKLLSYFFESVIGLFPNSEPHSQHLLLARRECGKDLARLLLKIQIGHSFRRRHDTLVFDEISQMAVLLLADRRLERDRFFGNLQYFAYLVKRDLHFLRDFLRRWLARSEERRVGQEGGDGG